MGRLTGDERQLLDRLAVEGKSIRLSEDDLKVAKSLGGVGLLFLVGEGGPYAVITPKGRRLLAARPKAAEGARTTGLID